MARGRDVDVCYCVTVVHLPLQALELLPPSTAIAQLLPFFEAVLTNNSQKHRDNQVVRNLLKSENLQVREQLIKHRKRMVRIKARTMCPVCNKRITVDQTFACYPNNTVVHFKCQTHKSIDPVTGEKFE